MNLRKVTLLISYAMGLLGIMLLNHAFYSKLNKPFFDGTTPESPNVYFSKDGKFYKTSNTRKAYAGHYCH